MSFPDGVPLMNDVKYRAQWEGKTSRLNPFVDVFLHQLAIFDGNGVLIDQTDPIDISSPVQLFFKKEPHLHRKKTGRYRYTVYHYGFRRTPSQTSYLSKLPNKDLGRVSVSRSNKFTSEFVRNRTRDYPSFGVPWNTLSSGSHLRPAESAFTTCRDYVWHNSTGVTLDTTVAVQSYSRTYTSVRSPNFGSLKKGSRLPINPYSLSVWHQDQGTHMVTVNNTFNGQQDVILEPMSRHHSLPGAPTVKSSVESLALKRLRDKISGETGNLAEDLAQYRQFVDMALNTMNRLSGSVMDLRHGNIPGAIKKLWGPKNPRFRSGGYPSASRSLAQNWLEMQYGWKPALADCRAFMEQLARFNLANDDAIRVSTSAKGGDETVIPVTAQNVGSIVIGSNRTVTETTVRFGVRYKVNSRLTVFLSQLGFTNPINLAWELLPFSFVVDWFLPIGPYLESLSTFHGMDFVDGFKTTFLRQRTSLVASGSYRHPTTQADWVERGTWDREWITVNRVKLTSFPSPTVPHFKNPLSPTHIANALALLKSSFGKR